MAAYNLTYFDMDGGGAEHIRPSVRARASQAWGRFETGLRGVLLTLTVPAEPRIFLGKLFCAP